jgi:hypothetical protein
MDKPTHYREILRRIVEDYASFKSSHGEIDSYPVIDVTATIILPCRRDRIKNGAFKVLSFIPISSTEKLLIQLDGTNRSVAKQLVEAGIPRDDIVLAEKPPHIRKHTGYGVG